MEYSFPALDMLSISASACPGSDYSQSSIDLARAVAKQRDMASVQWIVDDVLHSTISERYGIPLPVLSTDKMLCHQVLCVYVVLTVMPSPVKGGSFTNVL